MSVTKVKGFSAEACEQLEAAGWIAGTDCGYKNHTGFVRGGVGGAGTTYSLLPPVRGKMMLCVIRNGLCERKSRMTIDEVLSYFG